MAKTYSNPNDSLQLILAGLSKLPSVVEGTVSKFTKLLATVGSLSGLKLPSLPSSTTKGQGDANGTQGDPLSKAISGLTAQLVKLDATLTKLIGKAGGAQPVPTVPKTTEGEEGGLGSVVAGLGKVAAIAGGVAIAAGAVTVGFEQLLGKLQGFVGAISPATIEFFNRALLDLNATIGSGFLSVFQDLTQVINQAAAVIKPLIQQLAPLIKQVADYLGNMLVKMIQLTVANWRALIPLMEQLFVVIRPLVEALLSVASVLSILFRAFALLAQIATLLNPLTYVLKALAFAAQAINKGLEIVTAAFDIFEVAFKAIIDTAVKFVSSFLPVTDIMGQLSKAVQGVIKNLYAMSVFMAKFLGLQQVVDAIIASVEEKTKSKGDVAAQQVSIKSIDQLSKDLAIAAASAGGGGQGGVTNERQFWTDVLKDLQEIKNAPGFRQILEAILEAIRNLNPLRAGDAPKPPAPGIGGLAGAGIGAATGLPFGAQIGRMIGRNF